MIPYEDLCRALDIYNRKLRGEDVPEEAYQDQAHDDGFDIVESEEAGIEAADMEMDGQYDAEPDVTAETAVPEADFGDYDQPGSGEHADQEYHSGAAPGEPAAQMTSDQYSSGQQYQEGHDLAQEQYAEGQDQAPEQQPDAYPNDQDPNRQQ